MNTAISYIVYVLLVHFSMNAFLALVIAYICGMISSYLMNAKWTFQKETYKWRYIWRFVLANLFVLGLSEGTLWLIIKYIFDSKYLAQAINIVPTTFLGFLLNRFIVFHD